MSVMAEMDGLTIVMANDFSSVPDSLKDVPSEKILPLSKEALESLLAGRSLFFSGVRIAWPKKEANV